jgi:hypothetical protein
MPSMTRPKNVPRAKGMACQIPIQFSLERLLSTENELELRPSLVLMNADQDDDEEELEEELSKTAVSAAIQSRPQSEAHETGAKS